jgi:hypothetical protein
MATVEARLAALEAELAALKQEKQNTERRLHRRLSWWRGAAGLLLVAGLLLGYPHLGQAQGTLDQRVAVLEGKLARVSVVNNGADIVISGANLNIVNGLGDTQTTNGLGNLIIGYNEARGGGADARGGSHNLILGQRNNFTSISGICGGYGNSISGPFSCVLTGQNNTARTFFAVVGTRQQNDANGNYSVVLGGFQNDIGFNLSGTYASITGGRINCADGDYSTVSGGNSRVALGEDDWVGGGLGQDN